MKKLDDLICGLKEKLGNDLISVMIYGSKANYGLDKIKSNVDLLIVINNPSLDNMVRIRPHILKWIKAGNRYPLIISKYEFETTKDVFAIEYLDIQWNYQVVHGINIFENYYIKYNDLKSQCIRELKLLIMKFRNYYTVNYRDKKAIKKALVELISKLLVVFRTVLRLQNVQPSVFKKDLINQFDKIIHIDKKLFTNLVGQKEKTYDIPSYAVNDYSNLVLNEVNKILAQIVNL
jgi:hypothetical protein